MSSDQPWICLDCIKDADLKQLLNPHLESRSCSYCDDRGEGVSLQVLAEVTEPILREFIEPGPTMMVPSLDSDQTEYRQSGDELAWVLQEELGIDVDPAEALVPLLQERDPSRPQDGEEPAFDTEQEYQRRHIGPDEHFELWETFSDRIKHHRRYFDTKSKEMLDEIIGGSSAVVSGELLVLEIGPGTEVAALHRSRAAETESQALQYRSNPAKQVGPPPARMASAGRMNPQGISVFYSSLTLETAIAEIRPSVGSRVVAAQFSPNRSMKVLDLTRVGIRFTGSIFHPDYAQRASRARFLEHFHHIIAKPVLPNEEPLEYLPTQAVAEYVSSVLGLDGILYASAQTGDLPDPYPEPQNHISVEDLEYRINTSHNIVLIGQASRITTGEGDGGALQFVENSFVSRIVTGVNYNHMQEYLFDPNEPSDF